MALLGNGLPAVSSGWLPRLQSVKGWAWSDIAEAYTRSQGITYCPSSPRPTVRGAYQLGINWASLS
jgi:hypothetical protein